MTAERPGRPRDPRTDDAILGAVRELLAVQGYNRLSIEAVARQAGVTRPTVYRRWPTKAHLVHEAVYPEGSAHFPAHVDGEDFVDGVARFVEGALGSYRRPGVASAVPGLLADFRDRPELKELLEVRLAAVRESFRELVRGAVERGEARPDVDADLLYEALSGVVMFAELSSGRGAGPGFARQIAELVVRGAGS